jgi:hypothetical protein
LKQTEVLEAGVDGAYVASPAAKDAKDDRAAGSSILEVGGRLSMAGWPVQLISLGSPPSVPLGAGSLLPGCSVALAPMIRFEEQGRLP